MPVTVRARARQPETGCSLKDISLGAAFVDADKELLYIVVANGGSLTKCRCIRFVQPPTVVDLDYNLEVYPANVDIEWELA